jgi:hypothetical protein
MEKYTTQKILDAVKLDATIDAKEKAKEEAKTILPTETYALCDMINSLINKIEHARLNRK